MKENRSRARAVSDSWYLFFPSRQAEQRGDRIPAARYRTTCLRFMELDESPSLSNHLRTSKDGRGKEQRGPRPRFLRPFRVLPPDKRLRKRIEVYKQREITIRIPIGFQPKPEQTTEAATRRVRDHFTRRPHPRRPGPSRQHHAGRQTSRPRASATAISSPARR